eukprot:TRINITY_DN8561_c1_g1_i1.p1 TRINITY_DN8561_c1_g1~~TRINITY_DN8561_c1_g1_i1.p1  ORF type:complete len:411 (+),score=97.67 TRINITY_DN8561_c1_g1_i1:48-1235(+)
MNMEGKFADVMDKVQNATEEAVRLMQNLTREDLEEVMKKPEMISEAVIVGIAITTIIIGSSWSVGSTLRLKAGEKISKKQQEEDEDDDDEVHVSSKEAAMFPIAGSMVLLSLYMCYKLIPRELFNTILSLYFVVVSMYAVSPTIYSITKQGILSGLTAVGLGVGWWFTGHFAFNNSIAFCICITSLWKIKLPSFATSWILLWGLFLYDIWWVFGTEVMVSVAKNIEAPVLLKMPKNLAADEYKPNEMMMLGLGDIVIPGFFIAMCLRYDYSRAGSNGPTRIYFWTSLITYTLGLVNTIFVMMVFKHAQPALLYLVPWITFGTLFVSIITFDTFNMFRYSEEIKEPKTDDKDDTKDEDKKGDDDEGLSYVQAAYNIIVAELFHVERYTSGGKKKTE